MMFRQPYRLVRSEGADLQGLDGKFEVVTRTGGRSEMKYGIDSLADVYVLCDVMFIKAEALVPEKMRYVVHASRQKVIEADHFVSRLQQVITKMTSKESRSTRDHYSHQNPPRDDRTAS